MEQALSSAPTCNRWHNALARPAKPPMNAAVLHTLGKPPRFEQFPDPDPGENEVIVHVRAAALKPVDKQIAGGSHYASPRELPVVCGIDGVGLLDDGARVPRKMSGRKKGGLLDSARIGVRSRIA